MRPVVREHFYAFNEPMEGAVPWFYQDVKGLVSIGVGILCDPIELALGLPMVRLDGQVASRGDIVAEWLRIKSLGTGDHTQGNKAARLGHLYAQPHTRLRLTREGLESTLLGKLAQMDAYLAKRFPEYESWPADAQLGTLSLAWACGPAFRFPKLEAALRAKDFRTAAVECFMPEERTISGLRPRNRANRVLFTNAAVVQQMFDPAALYYPTDLDAGPVDQEADTQPEGIGPYRAEHEPATVHAFPEIQRPPVDFDPGGNDDAA